MSAIELYTKMPMILSPGIMGIFLCNLYYLLVEV